MGGLMIEDDKVYTEAFLRREMGLSESTLALARKTGALRFVRRGRRKFYLGRWLRDWLIGDNAAEAPTTEGVAC